MLLEVVDERGLELDEPAAALLRGVSGILERAGPAVREQLLEPAMLERQQEQAIGDARRERDVVRDDDRGDAERLHLLADEARQHALRFRRHNLQLFEKMYPHHRDRERMIAVVKQGRRQLEEQMARERAENEERRQRGEERLPGWDPAPGHAPREGGSDLGP